MIRIERAACAALDADAPGGRPAPTDFKPFAAVNLPRPASAQEPTPSAGERRVPRIALRALAVLWFVLCALILSLVWIVPAALERHLEDYERLLSEATGITVRAGSLEAGLSGVSPAVTLRDVTLARPGGPVSLRLPSVRTVLSWSSLWHLEPRFTALVVSDAALDVRRIAPDTLDVAGFVVDLSPSGSAAAAGDPQQADASSDGAALRIPALAWVMRQGRLLLERASLRYVDETVDGRPAVRLNDVTAAFEQRLLDWRAAVRGTVVAGAESAPKPFDIRARVERHLFMALDEPLSWRGELYADLTRTNVAAVLSRLGLGGVVSQGLGEARLRIAFDRGRIPSVAASLDLSDVRAQLAPGLAALELPQLSGRFSFSESDAGLTASADRIAFRGPAGTRFGPASLSADCTRENGRITGCAFRASEAVIGTLARIARALPLPEPALDFLGKHALSGTLGNIEASFSGDWADPAAWRASGEFTGLSMPSSEEGVPGLRNFSGTITSSGPGAFTVELDTHYASLHFPGVFREPRMDFTRITGRTVITLKPRLRVTFEGFRAENADAAVTAQGFWEDTGGAGTIDLSGKLLRGRGAAVHKYLPNVVGDAALDYVASGVTGGRVTRGGFIVRGELEHFPWDGDKAHPGQFLIEGDVERAGLDFMPSGRKAASGAWIRGESFPPITDITGHLEFAGNRMTITGRKGASGRLSATNVKVEIPSFVADPPLLTVEGDITGDLGEALGYLTRAKFITSIIGAPFAESKGSGPAAAHLSLRLPLDTAAADPVRYSVDAKLEKARFTYLPILPELTDVSGRLVVSEKGVATPVPFRGSTAAGPASVSSTTDRSGVKLSINATAAADDIRRLVRVPELEPLLAELSGASAVAVTASIPWEADTPVRIEGASGLAGLGSALPLPLSKAAAAELPARFSLSLGKDAMELSLAANPLLSLRLGFEKDALVRGHVSIGAPARNVSQGVVTTIRTGTLDLSAWSRIGERISERIAAAPDAAAGSRSGIALPPVLSRIELAAGRLVHEEKSLGAIDAVWSRSGPGAWSATLKGDAAEGRVSYRDAVRTAPARLNAKLSRLFTPEMQSKSSGAAGTGTRPLAEEPAAGEDSVLPEVLRTLTELPDVSLAINDLRAGERRIGAVTIETTNRPLPGGGLEWRLSSLTVRNAGATLSAKGAWRRNRPEDAGETAMHAALDVKNAGDMLSSLGVRGVVREAPGSATLDLAWRGQPFAFDAASLSGAASGRTGAGQLLQVEPGAGRLLSLLSMQHLMQRLTLDFRDVLSQGFRFDSIALNATIRSGIVKVSKATVAGSAATVVTSGDVDLVNNLLDLRSLVLPSINAEGPSLALAIANPAVGLGTLIAQWALKDQISSFLSTEYAVQGSIDDPVVTKIPSLRPSGPAQEAAP